MLFWALSVWQKRKNKKKKLSRLNKVRLNIFTMTKTLVLDKNIVKEGNFDDIKTNKVVWVDIASPQDKDFDAIASLTKIDKAEIVELLSNKQRPVVKDDTNHSIIVIHSPHLDPGRITTHPFLIFISKTKSDLITLHHRESLSVKRIFDYPGHRKLSVFKKGPTFILLTVVDEIINTYFSVMEDFDDKIEEIEDNIFDVKRTNQVMKKLFTVKRSLIYFHKALIANRDVISCIEKEYAKFIDKNYLEDFRELYTDLTQLVEVNATYHDILTSMVEIHLSSVSNSLNVTMKKVTSWGALILVPSLIASVFGMNFAYIPTLKSPAGFFLALFLMIVSVALLYWYFKKKDWI